MSTEPQQIPIGHLIANGLSEILAQVVKQNRQPCSVHYSINADGHFLQTLTVGNHIEQANGKLNNSQIIAGNDATVKALAEASGAANRLKIAEC